MQSGQSPTFVELMELERIGSSHYLAGCCYESPYPTYGGQILAQAIYAAGAEVGVGRIPHSIHCHFLRAGDTSAPTTYSVEPIKTGRTISIWKVTAHNRDRLVAWVTISFHIQTEGLEAHTDVAPAVPGPEQGAPFEPIRAVSFEMRTTQESISAGELPTRYWTRCIDALPPGDHLLHAAAIAYISDHSNAVAAHDNETHQSGPSLDHGLWFHAPAQATEWMLVDLAPGSVSSGRGWYAGRTFDRTGRPTSRFAQELMVVEGRQPYS